MKIGAIANFNEGNCSTFSSSVSGNCISSETRFEIRCAKAAQTSINRNATEPPIIISSPKSFSSKFAAAARGPGVGGIST